MSQNGLAAYFAGIRMFRLIQFDDRPLRAAARRSIITRALSFARVSGAILLVASSGASITPKPQLMAARIGLKSDFFTTSLPGRHSRALIGFDATLGQGNKLGDASHTVRQRALQKFSVL
jgi:hypothetical protein